MKYSPNQYSVWNEFVAKSKNATFLFHRDFMEYHQDRFEDFSLMVFKDEKLMALLPANKVGSEVQSHQGLSYGGLLLLKTVRFKDVLNGFQSVLEYLNEQAIEKLNLKLLPKIYHSFPSDEIEYLLFILQAKIQKKETLSTIDMSQNLKFSRDRINGIKRGEKHHLIVKETDDFSDFWNQILIVNLQEKHKVNPVHSLEEIQKLKSKFPKRIRQFNVYHNDILVAGTTIFETKNVAHCQYISGDKNKNILGSLDFLHHHLITQVFSDKPYYDFGSSNENDGLEINEGLQYWKEGFGARTVIHDFYSVDPVNVNLLKDVLK